MKYINLENAIFQTANDEFFVKVATNVEEACKLIEAGFEYVTGEYKDGGKISENESSLINPKTTL